MCCRAPAEPSNARWVAHSLSLSLVVRPDRSACFPLILHWSV
jgi:hypothetical protein